MNFPLRVKLGQDFSWTNLDILMNGFDLHVPFRCCYNANFKTISPPMRSIWIHFSLRLHFQTSMNRKQAETVAKKKLDNLMKESKIRDREDPDSFTIAALPPTGKHDKSPLKVNMLYFAIHVTPSSPGEEMLPHLQTKWAHSLLLALCSFYSMLMHLDQCTVVCLLLN